MNKDIYLNCGVYTGGNVDVLFIAEPGYFASTAWCESDEAYNAISGSKFEAITSDDGLFWTLDRNAIRRLTEEDNIEDFLDNANEEFIKVFDERWTTKN